MSRHDALNELERELARQLRDGPSPQPDDALDARILAQARAAVSPVPVQRVRRRPWLVGLASAAVLVLSVGVIVRVVDEPPDAESALLQRPAEPELRAIPSAAESDSLFEGQAVAEIDDPAAASARDELERINITGSRIRHAPQPAAVEAPSMAEPAPSVQAEAAEGFVPTPPKPAASRPSAEAARREVQPAAPAQSAPSPPATMPPPPIPSSPPMYSSPAPAPAAAGPRAGGDVSRLRQALPAQSGIDRIELREESAGAVTAESERALAAQADADPDEHVARELKAIRTLIAQDELTEARTRIAALRRSVPDLELPPDLVAVERGSH